MTATNNFNGISWIVNWHPSRPVYLSYTPINMTRQNGSIPAPHSVHYAISLSLLSFVGRTTLSFRDSFPLLQAAAPVSAVPIRPPVRIRVRSAEYCYNRILHRILLRSYNGQSNDDNHHTFCFLMVLIKKSPNNHFCSVINLELL